MKEETTTFAKLMGADVVWRDGFYGQGIRVAVIDNGLTKDFAFEESLKEEINFTNDRILRAKQFWHGSYICKSILHLAPRAELSFMRVGSRYGTPIKSSTVDALKYCIDQFPKYRVVNISLSFNFDDCPENCELCKLVNIAYKKGILVVIAAGNRGFKDKKYACPATAEWAFKIHSVTSESENDWIESVYRNPLKRLYYQMSGKLSKRVGTSFSAGYATGSVALLQSAFPKIIADDLRFVMKDRYRHFKEIEGLHYMKVDECYKRLTELKRLQEIGVILTKEGHNLYPILQRY